MSWSHRQYPQDSVSFPINAGCCIIFLLPADAAALLWHHLAVRWWCLVNWVGNCLAKSPRSHGSWEPGGARSCPINEDASCVRCWQRCFIRQQLHLQVQLQVRKPAEMGDEQNKLSLILNNLSHSNGGSTSTSSAFSAYGKDKWAR